MSRKVPDKIVERLCKRILDHLKNDGLIQLKAGENVILQRMMKAFHDDLEKERLLDAEARQLLDRYRAAIDRGEIDEQKMYQMIRKQLIKDKKLVI